MSDGSNMAAGRFACYLEVGSLDGAATADLHRPHGRHAIEHTTPEPAYVELLLTGLAGSHDWDRRRAAAYVRARVEGGEWGH